MSMSTEEIDLSISTISESFGQECQWTVNEECKHLNRIIFALRYYDKLNPSQNKEGMNIFASFILDNHNTELLNDWHHILSNHNEDLQQIQDKYFSDNKCSVNKCKFSRRYFQNERVNDYGSFDQRLRLYAETLDCAHYHFMHLYETGMRTAMNENNEFAQIVEMTDKRRKITQNFDRFAAGNKFNLANNDQKNHSNTTFLNEAIVKVKSKVFEKYLFEEAFDSDSIEIDVMKFKTNIFILLQKENAINAMKEFIKTVKRQKNTFSIGWRFYYWPKYENDKDYDFVHVNTKTCDLFVAKKFDNFKAEIFAYENITNEHYDNTMTKALELHKTQRVKETESPKGSRFYVISPGAVIGLWHLIAIILYTDFSVHSSQFSASFRSLTPFESLEVTRKRNANFYWMARHLREAVEGFGKSRNTGWPYESNGIYGPFYCGINRRMIIPQFNIRLNAPTSTTKQITVALQFGGSDGTILQLNNDSDGDRDYLRAFDVSYISRYPAEDERLFIGGRECIRLETVRFVKSKQNFISFFEPLFYLDAMLTAANERGLKALKSNIDKAQCVAIKHLFEYKMGKVANKRMDPYIYETFDAYCSHKIAIQIDLGELGDANSFMRDLILNSYEECADLREESDETNLIRSLLAVVFPNVANVRIAATFSSFSLLGLLKIVERSKWKKIQVQDYINGGWLLELWQSSQRALIVNEYKLNGYAMEYDGEHVLSIEQRK